MGSFWWPAHSFNETISTKMQKGNWFHILSRKKKWHWWSHQSGLWMHCHLHRPSTAVRHSDCRVRRPHGPQREVRSLFTLISHALGQNNKHSSSLHMLMHCQMKNCVQDIILHETLCLNPVLLHLYSNQTHTVIKDIQIYHVSNPWPTRGLA